MEFCHFDIIAIQILNSDFFHYYSFTSSHSFSTASKIYGFFSPFFLKKIILFFPPSSSVFWHIFPLFNFKVGEIKINSPPVAPLIENYCFFFFKKKKKLTWYIIQSKAKKNYIIKRKKKKKRTHYWCLCWEKESKFIGKTRGLYSPQPWCWHTEDRTHGDGHIFNKYIYN